MNRAARWMIAGEWRAHPARVVTAVAAIMVGVALGFAVHLVNASALDHFARGVAAVRGNADLRVEAASPTGFDERLYPRLARWPGVAAASPAIFVHARAGGAAFDLLGLDVLRARSVTPALLPRPAAGGISDALFDPRSIFLSAAALRAVHGRVGERIAVRSGTQAATFVIAGTLPGADPDRAVGVMDIAAAQWRFGRPGRLDRIDIRLAPDADARKVRAAIAAQLPADAMLAGAGDDLGRADALSRAYRVNLDMLALVALLTGAFLVYSAQALSVTRRRPQFALLRVLGAPRRAILGQILAEGAALGAVGAALGLLAGLALAAGVLRLVGGDLGSGYFPGGERPVLLFAPGAAIGFAALGLVAALLGSWLPARAAAGIAPAIALRNLGDATDPRHRPAILPALLLAAAGVMLAALPAVRGLPVFGYGAIALLLAAGIAAMPWLARALLAPLARRPLAWPAMDLAIKRLWGAPGQAAVALSGIVASTGLMIAMAVMVASFRGSVDEWLGQILPADLYLSGIGGGPPSLDPATQARLAAVPGVGGIAFSLQQPIALAADRPPLMLIVRDDPAHAFPAIGRSVTPRPGDLAMWISEPAARLYGLAPGQRILLPIGPGARSSALIAGRFRDYARQQGAIAMAAADYDRLTRDRTRGEAAIRIAPGARVDAVARALGQALPPDLRETMQIVPVAALRARALAIFDRSFAITYGLEAVAILVGLAGVAATVSAQTIARTREFGMLRHLGLTRWRIAAMLGIEGALLGLVGGIAGVMLGCGVAQVLIRVVNPQSFHWTMETRLPGGLLLGVVGALVLSAAGTAMIAGRRAVALDAVRAVREDW